jgi:molybdenum cofactor cytidylyltransferase
MKPQLVALIPAAGHSRRMGQPKLLLDLGGRTIMARVVDALRQAGIARCIVVVRPGDTALAHEATIAGAEVVTPVVAPIDMRQSVEYGLREVGGSREKVESTPALESLDGWVLVPADHPALQAPVIRELVAVWVMNSSRIVVPVYNGQRGHPTIFPWSLSQEVFTLLPDQGLNHLLRSVPDRVLEVSVSDPHVLDDLDTPEDLRRLREKLEQDMDLPSD